MIVGYTFAERLLEIGLRYHSTDTIYVFHAQNVSPQYRKLFEEDWAMAKLNSKQLKKAHADIKNDARRRVAERGVLQFRADPETVLAILDAAEKQKVPVGTLLRQWIQERLTIDTSKAKAPDLVQRVASLEEAVTDLQQRMKHRR